MKRHLKALAAPKSWPIKRKEKKFVTRPSPGAHSFKKGMPLSIVLRDLLNLAKTRREINYILNNNEILIDGRRVKRADFITGFMDVLSIPKIKEDYRISINKKGQLCIKKIKKDEANIKPCKIIGKRLIKKKVQINLYDGKNFLSDKHDYKIGDSVLIELPSNKIKDVLKLEKKSTIFITGGKNIGEIGIVENIKNRIVYYKLKGLVFETLKDNVFVIGKEKATVLKNEQNA
jgi:small subunit ribosomal protein S4e